MATNIATNTRVGLITNRRLDYFDEIFLRLKKKKGERGSAKLAAGFCLAPSLLCRPSHRLTIELTISIRSRTVTIPSRLTSPMSGGQSQTKGGGGKGGGGERGEGGGDGSDGTSCNKLDRKK